MKKVLFIDRDGTIIAEPPEDFQVDSLEKLVFLPKALSNLRKLSEEGNFELAMVTNQDGMGTESFPEETFWPAHDKMMKTLQGECVDFEEVFIDRSFEHEGLETRKPGTGLLGKYINNPQYDLANSFVLGDRMSDMQLAKNLGAKGIFVAPENTVLENGWDDIVGLVCDDWDQIYHFLKLPPRLAKVQRDTKETKISVELNLDGTGLSAMDTGIGFFDHMLDQLAKHSGADITIKVKGDLHIDEHHTIEDTALALGEAFLIALGDKRGTSRYGFLLPMDEALAQVAIDFSGRPWIVWDASFTREKVGEMPTEMFMHFFKSFSDASKCNLNIKCEGDNEHHKIEAIFKGWAKAIKMAISRDINAADSMPSTKGIL